MIMKPDETSQLAPAALSAPRNWFCHRYEATYRLAVQLRLFIHPNCDLTDLPIADKKQLSEPEYMTLEHLTRYIFRPG